MKKLFTLLTMLIVGIGSMWADSNWAIYSDDLTQYGWTAMGDNTPEDVTALGSQVEGKPLTAYYRTENISLEVDGAINVLFRYSAGSHRLEILGVDILDGNDNIVGSDYHFGYTGGNHSNNKYTIENVSAGSYKLRYIINGKGISNSVGNIWVGNDVWNINSANLTTDGWAAMGENAPKGVKDLGNYTPLSRTQNISVSDDGIVKVLYRYTYGNHRLDILGADILDENDNVVGSDYHYGYTGGQHSNNTYTIENIPAGSYKLRYIIHSSGLSNSFGKITISTIKYNAWNITSSDLSTDFWSAMGEDVPSGVTDLGNYTPYSRTQNVTLTDEGYLEFIFHWNTGTDRLDMLGVDLLDGNDNVVAYDYHYGKAGDPSSNQTYLLSVSGLSAGSYKLRYIIHKDGNLDNSQGIIKVNKIKVASSFANISQWYVLRVHTNNGHYMYYDNTATYKYGFTQSTTGINSDSYLWGFVKSGDGVQVYNKAAGNTIALNDNNPSTVSEAGVANDFAFTIGKGALGTLGEAADAVFTLTHTNGNALNYNAGNKRIQQWNGNDAGSAFMIYEAEPATTISYTLTDTNGANYSGSYTGMAGVTEPPITGCDGYQLTNKTWDGTNYTATITFPFPVYSNGIENPTFIQSYLGTSLWYAKDGNVIADNEANTPQTFYDTFADNYRWLILPVLSGNVFNFALYNIGAGKYIPNNPSVAYNSPTTLTANMLEVGAFQYAHYNKGNGFYDTSSSKFLTINTSGTAQNIWLWSAPAGTGHQGSNMSFPTLTIVSVSEAFAALKGTTKFDILEGSTVMGPGEFAAPASINAAIDAAQDVEDNDEAKFAFIESDNGKMIKNYLNQVKKYGQPVSVKITMNKEYGTMILPAGCTRVTGLDIYSVNETVGNTLTLTPVEGNYIAKTPYIIHAEEGSKYTLVCWNTNSGTHTSGWLTGVLNSTTDIPVGSYMLATNKTTKVQAFYKVTGSGVKCAINKCYLTVPSASDARTLYLDVDGEITAIEEVFGDETEQGAIYNLAGQRLTKVQKGINIINGKKIIK